MKLKSHDKTRALNFIPCPFCGCEPKVCYIGNYHTKKRSIEIKCPGCRVKMKNSALIQDFAFLEDVTLKYWNKRVDTQIAEPSVQQQGFYNDDLFKGNGDKK